MTATGSSQAAPGPALQLEYPPLAELQVRPAHWWQDVLGVVLYGVEPMAVPLPVADVPIVSVASEQLGTAGVRAEVWRLPASGARDEAHGGPGLRGGQSGVLRYRYGRGVLFAAQCASAATGTSMQDVTRLAYAGLFELLRGVDYPHPLRLWNYLPDIHAGNAGAERYAQFNAGRQDAFLRAGRRLAGEVPAASVLGVRATRLVNLYGLATHEAPLSVENPRQCSAWDYPREYGERRPTFARACIVRTGGTRLFISGTASIVGHRSEHRGEPAAQTRETLRNIRALLAAANERTGAQSFTEQDLAYKIYVRHPQDQPAIECVLREELGNDPLCLFLRADVCRPELLVEIEAASV